MGGDRRARRKVSEYKDAGDKKKDKFIAMFYWTWHQGNDDTTYQVKNISEIVQIPRSDEDYRSIRRGYNVRAFFWEQLLHCWVQNDRPWYCATRRMLADAGVDAVFFDCTNGSLTWRICTKR